MRPVLVPVSPSAGPGSFPHAPTTLNRSAIDVAPTASAAPSATGTAQPSDVVVRPAGLRHGRWEAPAWAFWTAGALVVVLALAYVLGRLGYLRKKTG
jgi:hypothetical protein